MMDMSVTSVGSGVNLAAQPESFQDRGSAQRAQVQAAQLRAEAAKQFDALQPGNQEAAAQPKMFDSAAADLERVSLAFNKKLQFVVDHHSNEIIVKVIDKETDKVIKELPPEELQRLHSELRETIGFLFDERV
jgi:flagellar protein FlaG